MYFSSFTKQNSNNQKKVQRSGGFKIKLNPISRQLIRMTWGSRFQLEMVKGSLDTLAFKIAMFRRVVLVSHFLIHDHLQN